MKRSFYSLPAAIMILLLSLTSCDHRMNIPKEEAAIKTVINSETQAWIDRNPDLMKKYYIQDRYQTRLNIQDSVYMLSTGWDKRSIAIDTLAKYADWKGVDHFKVQKDFLVIKVMDRRTAWAILRETQDMVFNGTPSKSVSIINIVLEKPDHDWKISCFVKSNI